MFFTAKTVPNVMLSSTMLIDLFAHPPGPRAGMSREVSQDIPHHYCSKLSFASENGNFPGDLD